MQHRMASDQASAVLEWHHHSANSCDGHTLFIQGYAVGQFIA